jgi:hypothetical protein
MEIDQTPKNLSFFYKIIHFLAAISISEIIIASPIADFLESQIEKGILNLGEGFKFEFLIWGEKIGPNILHIFMLIFLASVFGYTFGYLQPKLNQLEKILIVFFYVLFKFNFLYLLVSIHNFSISKPSMKFDDFLSYQFSVLSHAPTNFIFFIIGTIAMICFTILYLGIGMSQSSQNKPREKGTFLKIKWYHFLWLYIPVAVYFHLFLKLTYMFYTAATNVLKEFKIFDFLFRGGVRYEMSEQGEYSITIVVTFIAVLAIYIVLTSIIWRVMKYLRMIVIGETSQSLWMKILICVLIGIIIPSFIRYYFLI